jgi:hypothetical protein
MESPGGKSFQMKNQKKKINWKFMFSLDKRVKNRPLSESDYN